MGGGLARLGPDEVLWFYMTDIHQLKERRGDRGKALATTKCGLEFRGQDLTEMPVSAFHSRITCLKCLGGQK